MVRHGAVKFYLSDNCSYTTYCFVQKHTLSLYRQKRRKGPFIQKTKIIKKMAISQNPMTGKMSGTVGNFVTSSLGSQNIVRAKAFSRKDAKTEAQVKQRNGFKMIADLFPALGSIPAEGFVQRSSNTSVYVAFMAANMQEAIDKSGETSVIDYSKLIVSDGSLSKVIVTEAILDETGITITYLTQLKNQMNYSTDEVVAVVLLKTGELWIERQERGSELSNSILIPLTNNAAADIQAAYVFAKRADGSKASKTTYVPLIS
jgi:hypothetical protein